jgi:hypothetical protein
MDDLKKATPPPLPKDAFKQPSKQAATGEMPSPWDSEVVSSAPKPAATPAKGLNMPQWMGRSILHPDHAQELELNSAVNEFGLKMPRQQAEDEAYKQYVKGQRTQAAAHHLAGMNAAIAGGNPEAARKHHMMYSLHTKALGGEPVGAPHPDVKALVDKGGPKVYNFKAHKGDAMAIAPMPEGMPYQGNGIFSSAPAPQPALGKAERELLYLLHQAGTQILAKAEAGKKLVTDKFHGDEPQLGASVQPAGPGTSPRRDAAVVKGEMDGKAKHCKCDAYKFPHRHGGGYCRQKKP